MKYSNLIISGVPKSFRVDRAVDLVQPLADDARPEDVLFDMYPAECDGESGEEEACVMFKYDESATGVEVVHSPHLQALSVGLLPWASDADVQLFAAFVNAFLVKHKRARLYEGAAPLGGLSDDDVRQMIEERRAYLAELLSTQESITMEGLRASATLGVAEFRAAVAPDQQVCELQRQFIEMQWE